MNEPSPGQLLISDPFLKDPNFKRSVVYLCNHDADGTIGFVLNRPFENTLDEMIDDLEGHPVPVFYGGPVQSDTLQFLHTMPAKIPGGEDIGDGVFWGGNFETVLALIKTNQLDFSRIRFFLGYSGWSAGQLQQELDEKSWLTTKGNRRFVFQTKPDYAWKDAVKLLGKDYAPIINYPIDPQLN